ncbi:Alpha/beta hydrolase [Tenacibaculum sp. 190524A05c]|uniref:alpha/beta hydrolase family protein n=1 Tax=Tenacibaculum platacis TaxID=3137852 RepID=UPI0031FAB2D7
MITKFLSNMIVKGGIAPLFDNPANYKLEYEDVEFKTKDGINLKGWLIKGGKDKVIVQSHFGVQSSRSGYTPKGKGMVKMWKEDISFLKHVKYLVAKGYSVLMYDFRSHGESDANKSGWCSWGPDESQDVVAAVNFVANHPDYKSAQIGLLSICMGAAASTYAFGKNELQQYNVKAMVAIQPMRYSDFMKSFGLPSFLNNWVNKENSKRVGFDMTAKSFKSDVPKISVPTLIMQNVKDEFLAKDSIDEFYHDLNVEKEMFWITNIGTKRAAGYDYLTKNPEKVGAWFDKYMN